MQAPFSTMTETPTTPTIPYWLVMMAGIAAFLAGLLLLISPGMTILVIVQILGAYWLVIGILSLVGLFIDSTLWGWKLITGVLGVLAGVVVLRDPLWSAILVPAVLVIFLALEALLMGVSQGIHAFSGGGLGLGIMGLLNIIFGVILLFNPFLGVVGLSVILGILAVIGGSVMAIRAFMTRPHAAPMQQPPPAAQQRA